MTRALQTSISRRSRLYDLGRIPARPCREDAHHGHSLLVQQLSYRHRDVRVVRECCLRVQRTRTRADIRASKPRWYNTVACRRYARRDRLGGKPASRVSPGDRWRHPLDGGRDLRERTYTGARRASSLEEGISGREFGYRSREAESGEWRGITDDGRCARMSFREGYPGAGNPMSRRRHRTTAVRGKRSPSVPGRDGPR